MRIDCHLHVVGTGCRYRPRGVTRYGAPFMLCGVGLRASALKRMLEPELAARILHGSDVPVTGALLWAFGLIRWSEWRAAARTANPVERDAQIKRAPGLGEETFARLAQWLRRA